MRPKGFFVWQPVFNYFVAFCIILLFRSNVFFWTDMDSIVKSFLLGNPTKPSKTEQPPT